MNFKICVALAGSAVLMAAVASTEGSPKPTITCKEGNCTGAGCYNTSSFGTTKNCKTNEICAVLEVSATNFTMSCQTSTQCKSLEEKGTAACCEANNCIPDLAKAKAKATAKNNGCVSREMNMGFVLAIMAILLPKLI